MRSKGSSTKKVTRSTFDLSDGDRACLKELSETLDGATYSDTVRRLLRRARDAVRFLREDEKNRVCYKSADGTERRRFDLDDLF
jgi:hypothetical protein